METKKRYLKNIKEYTKQLKEKYKKEIELMTKAPSLAIIQVGSVEASNRYVRNKVKDCQEVGVDVHVYEYPNNITEFELYEELFHLNDFYDGIIVQLPLPAHIRQDFIIKAIEKEKDVDGFKPDGLFDPATPKGIMDYLKYCEFDVAGKDVVIIGRSEIVGKPLARMMCAADATVTLCHSKSRLDHHVRTADLVVSAVGKAGFLNCYSLWMPVIDVGINFNEDGKLVGDCINIEDRDVTPVPGGVGLLTRCALLDNVIAAARLRDRNRQPLCEANAQCNVFCNFYDKGGCKNV